MSSLQDDTELTEGEQIAITMIAAISGFLSVLGSSVIIYMIVFDWHAKMSLVKFRLLFALSLSDIVNSLWFVTWSLPIPKDTPGVWGALGNKTTCDVQGFFLQFGIIGSFYNGALCGYFMHVLCYGMSDEEIAHKYETWFHLIATVWPVGTAITAYVVDVYSFCALGCWIAPEPIRCTTRDNVECVRGEHAYMYVWLFTGAPLLLILGYITYTMRRIYVKVKQVSLRAEQISIYSRSIPSSAEVPKVQNQWNDHHHHHPNNNNHHNRHHNMHSSIAMSDSSVESLQLPQQQQQHELNSHPIMNSSSNIEDAEPNKQQSSSLAAPQQTLPSASSEISFSKGNNNKDGTKKRSSSSSSSRYAERVRETAIQALLYVLAYLVTHIWAFVCVIIEQAGGTNPFSTLFLQNLFWPMQGLLNVFVFLRPRIQETQKVHVDMGYWQAAYCATFHYDELLRNHQQLTMLRRKRKQQEQQQHKQKQQKQQQIVRMNLQDDRSSSSSIHMNYYSGHFSSLACSSKEFPAIQEEETTSVKVKLEEKKEPEKNDDMEAHQGSEDE